MVEKPHRAIQELQALRRKFALQVNYSGSSHQGLRIVHFHLRHLVFEIWIDDEYGDLNTDNQLISLFLVLLELRNYQTSNDFLEWSNDNGLDANDVKALEYYRGLSHSIRKLEEYMKEIPCPISQWEYEMGYAVIDELRSLN